MPEDPLCLLRGGRTLVGLKFWVARKRRVTSDSLDQFLDFCFSK